MAWIRAEAHLFDTDYNKLKVIPELLYVQHHYINLDCSSMEFVIRRSSLAVFRCPFL